MAFTRIMLWLGNAFVFCALLMVVSALAGLGLSEYPAASLFGVFSVISGILGGALVLLTRQSLRQENAADALIFLILFWGFTPAILAFPFMGLPSVTSYAQAYFEAASAITTTGASRLDADALPRTFVFWRSLLQFFGGVATATFAVVILAALNLSGTGVHRSKLFTLKRGELFSRLLTIGRSVTLVYAAIASVCLVFLALSGTPLFDALCLSLSAISTGGLTPHSGPLSGYVSRFGAFVLAVTCLFGAANIGVLWDVLRHKSRRGALQLIGNVEHRGIFAILALLALFGIGFTGLSEGFPVLVESAYMVSGAGFDYDVIGIDMVPPSLLIATALIGGSALSTAGGIKIIRLILLISHAHTDLSRMSHPSRVKLVHFKGQKLPDAAFLSIWMYFFGYTLVFAAATTAMGAAGVDFTAAVVSAAAALSNMGPLLEATFPQYSYSAMNGLQLTILSIVMIIGRVEVLAALAALSPSLWRR